MNDFLDFLFEEKFTTKRIISIIVLLIIFFRFYAYIESFEIYLENNYVVGTQTYSNDYLSFEFPENWSYQEFSTWTSFYNEYNDLAVTLSLVLQPCYTVGGDIKNYTKAYERQGHKNFEIIELTHMQVDGYPTDKLITKHIYGREIVNSIIYIISSIPGPYSFDANEDEAEGLDIIISSLNFTANN